MAGQTAEQAETVAFLSDPHTHGTDKVERHETHGAFVFLAGDRAYKLKRAVKYPYMDFSTVALREAMCRKELEVNRRAAPDLYLEVRPIIRDAGRLRFGTDAERERAIDWVVVMRRFAQAALLEDMRRKGALDLALMRALGWTIAGFHKSAPIEKSFGGAKAIAAVIDQTASLLAAMPEIFAARDAETLTARAHETLDHLATLLDGRRERGFVRRCHGDLHLNNIYLDQGKPVLFDAIEFEDAFSCIDVFYDLSFLLMDLVSHGLRAHASIVLNRYLEATFDFEGLSALPLFLSCRAGIRAHVSATASLLAEDAQRAQALRSDALAFFRSALAYLESGAPLLVAIGGHSGTGKSTLAYRLAPGFAPPPGAIVLRSDVFRKYLAGVGETERLPSSAYTPRANAEVYAALTGAAAKVVSAGYAAIVDAVHGREEDREALARAAASAHVPFIGVWLDSDAEQMMARIRARSGDASDATVDVLKNQLKSVVVPAAWRHVDASQDRDDVLSAARAALSDALPSG